jgi:hypothetical protein
MIERVVVIKLKPELGDASARLKVAADSQQALAAIPGVVSVHTGAATGDGADWDVMLSVRFAEADDIEPYRIHPLHRAYVDDYLKPRMSDIRAWNFQVSE